MDVNDDWHERMPTLALALDQEKARALGVTSESLAQAMQAQYSGLVVGQYREGNKLIDIVWRAKRELRDGPRTLRNVGVPTGERHRRAAVAARRSSRRTSRRA